MTVEEDEFIYSGSDDYAEVGIMMTVEVARSLERYWAESDRIIVAKIRAHPFNLCVIQVNAPTGDHSDQEIDSFYEQSEGAKRQTGSQDAV